MKPRLWGIGTTRTFRAHHALLERQIDYETVAIRTRTADQDLDDFNSVAVSGKIPVYQEGDLIIRESAAIVRYVMNRNLPARSLVDQSFFDQWAFFIISELDATALYVLRRHEGLPEIYGASEEASRSAREYFDRQITGLSQALLDGRTHLADEFSELDILLISVLDWADFVRQPLPDAAKQYAEGIRQRQAYKDAYALNYGRTRSI
jgi:glutathione S-transferase